MPSNIEIKARITDLTKIEGLLAGLSDTPPKRLKQRDTFFRCEAGRLKLREIGAGESELIFYARADVAGTKQSDYEIAPVTDAAKLKSVLEQALGETVVVEKTRLVSLIGQTRVHLDAVEGLGNFLELEVVLREGQSPTEGHAIARDLMQQLGIQEADLIATAYADMLMERAVGASAASDPPLARSATGRPEPEKGARCLLGRSLTCSPGGCSVRDMEYSKLITIEPGKRSGQPCIRGMRITVQDVLEYLASGMTSEEVLADFPDLTAEDIRACLAFAADRERRLRVVPAA